MNSSNTFVSVGHGNMGVMPDMDGNTDRLFVRKSSYMLKELYLKIFISIRMSSFPPHLHEVRIASYRS